MFEKASRLKLRFNYRGLCSVEDLWEISIEALDAIYKVLNAKSKEQKEESLLDTKSQEDEILVLKIDIVKYIMKVRLQEKKDKENAALRAGQKQKLLEIIAKKQDEKLESMSVEDLTKLVNEL